MNDDWLEQIRQLHEADKAKRSQPKKEQQITEQDQAANLLTQSRAHDLLRQVQKTLLDGQGLLEISDRAGQYERMISLAWQGPISDARKPNPDDSEDYWYILVGVRDGKLWVNGKPVPAATPDALKTALLRACKNPGRVERGSQ